ncbi:26S proteasome non-ATPase regulatory subunit 13-like B [Hondaea fermentalgiana]|uniref:26S proteasome non-ATPase regulatory subunit 13-like B n=1 Tax=Hondaea fermentalgiana TaxID=2315210 RepID=A0A2R5GVC3_9STRA|nr:26S proteasome non-ATPase regulatory subunit 13-like B [Hondaea fermentalgiana]|eukprot:GBG32603.1 26S proteasome non-ATPase regulatory subunit 13-like B [Hondaea fermentalgiana]
MDFLDQQTSKYADIGEHYQHLGDLYSSKLWHQLTEELSRLVALKEFNRGRNLIDLYEHFISKFEGKLNQLKFIQIASVIARQYCPTEPPTHSEVEDAVGFMEFLCEKRARLGEDAYLVARMSIAELLVQVGDVDALKEARKILDDAQPVLQELAGTGAETVVNSSFYRVSCEYYKVAGPADEFYKSCIQFLAYTPQETLEPDVQHRLAMDMSLAALVGETVFNFGEVLAQPVLRVLDNSDSAWLHQLLEAFSAGDIEQFSETMSNNKSAVTAQPVLTENLELLRQKIALLCLMQTIFVRPPEDRLIPLKEIAYATRLEDDQVEWLLMKAMSKGLIKGSIDQIDQTVQISWLKPRVLDPMQLETLRDKLVQWSENVDKTLGFIEGETPELFQ